MIRSGPVIATYVRAFLLMSMMLSLLMVAFGAAQAVVSSPDLQIKLDSATNYSGANIYQTTASGVQDKLQALTCGGTAVFWVKIKNNTLNASSFVLRETRTVPTGWTITYYKQNGTTSITLPYTTSSLAVGGTEIIKIVIKASTGVALGTSAKTQIRAFLDASDTVVQDAVQAQAAVGKPDLLIRKLSESAFSGSTIYQKIPASSQVKTTSIIPGETATFIVEVKNRGNVPLTYYLKAKEVIPAGWCIVYCDATGEITLPLTTMELQPGECVDIWVNITAKDWAPIGSCASTIIQAFLTETDTIVRDSVQAIAKATGPDLQISNAGSALSGNNIYQECPSGVQEKCQIVAPGTTAVFCVAIQNDTPYTRSFELRAEECFPPGWTVEYDINGNPIYFPYTTGDLLPGGCEVITVCITPPDDSPHGPWGEVKIQAFFDEFDCIVRDAVEADVQAGGPDLAIEKSGDPASCLQGIGIFQKTPSGVQILSQTAGPLQTACYEVDVVNDTTQCRKYLLKARESTEPGWCVEYFDCNNTAIDLVSGWYTPVLNPGQSAYFKVLVTSATPASADTTKCVTVKVFLNSADCERDVVKLATTEVTPPPSCYKPDLLIRKGGDTGTGIGDGIYSNTGTNETLCQTVTAGTKAIYQVRIENDGTSTDTIKVNGIGGNSYWQVKYYDALSYGNDITSQILAGKCVTLDPGCYVFLRIEVCPNTSASTTTPFLVKVCGQSQNDTLKVDVVVASTKRQ